MPNPLKEARVAYMDLYRSAVEEFPEVAELHARRHPESPVKHWREEALRGRRSVDFDQEDPKDGYDPFG